MNSRRLYTTGLTVLAASCAAIAVAMGVMLVPGIVEDVTRNYNEGWVVEVAARFIAGEPLYTRTDGVVSANYPPLWYWLLAAVGTAGLDMNTTGRVIEILSLPACAAFVALIALRLDAGPRVAVFAGVAFLGIAGSWLPAYIGINDPHLTGQAIMLAGVWLALRRTPMAMWLGALLCAIAGFAKHSLLPIPFSFAAYLLLVDRRAFIHFALALASCAAAGLIACTMAWGADFWSGIAPDRAHQLWRLRLHVERNVPLYAVVVATGAVGAAAMRAEPRLTWPLIYLAMATALGLYAQTVPGASLNHQYDVLIALTLVLAVSGHAPAHRTGNASCLAWTVLVGCMVVLLANTMDSAPRTLEGVTQRQARNQEADSLIATIAGYSGRVACEDAILCMRAGKFSALDFYNVGQALETGALETSDVVRALTGTGVVAIQFYGEPGQSGRLPDDAVSAILMAYPDARIQTNRYSLVQRRCPPESDCH